MEKAKFPVCFKDFHDQALLRVCGHPKYTHLAYCFNASRVSEVVRGPGPGSEVRKGIIYGLRIMEITCFLDLGLLVANNGFLRISVMIRVNTRTLSLARLIFKKIISVIFPYPRMGIGRLWRAISW